MSKSPNCQQCKIFNHESSGRGQTSFPDNIVKKEDKSVPCIKDAAVIHTFSHPAYGVVFVAHIHVAWISSTDGLSCKRTLLDAASLPLGNCMNSFLCT